MCIRVNDDMFTGDTLFAGSIGRTDFYSGDYKQIEKSLKKLAKFENKVKIHPGHGPSSTLGIEKMSNPYNVKGDIKMLNVILKIMILKL